MQYEFDVGPWTRSITTSSPEAQRWFDRGLNWTYAYNHEEGVDCFRRALAHDAQCAMAWWGVAYAAGPFYNRPWIRFSNAEVRQALPVCFEAAQKAVSLAGGCTADEQALINAIALRYQSPDQSNRETLDAWHRAYTDAMYDTHKLYPNDDDIAALFAEAAVTCTPRQLWDLETGEAKPSALTKEALDALEPAMARIEQSGTVHPLVAHMYIHTVEMSPRPERALGAADMLCGYAPDAGHLEHMPAHIYVLCGDYVKAVAQSERAVVADDKYVNFAGEQNFYTTARCHDLHLLMYASMFLGQSRPALAAARRMDDMASTQLLETSSPFIRSILDAYSAMQTHVMVRFGLWDELTLLPPPSAPHLRIVGTAMHAYAQSVAHSALGNIDQAELAHERFNVAFAAVPDNVIMMSNPVVDVLKVGEAMLIGELEYRKQNYAEAFESLRLAVARDDALNFSEPWPWMHPPRHALGALLAEQGHHAEAQTVFREDLGLLDSLPRPCQHPDNVWALQGLVDSIEASGGAPDLMGLKTNLANVRQLADVSIESACFCSSKKSAISGV